MNSQTPKKEIKLLKMHPYDYWNHFHQHVEKVQGYVGAVGIPGEEPINFKGKLNGYWLYTDPDMEEGIIKIIEQ